MNWDLFVQLTVNGLTLGSVYALIALGFSMVYGILGLLNLAHGDVVTVGAFIGWGVLGVLGGDSPVLPVWLLITVMMVAAMLGSGLLGVAIERFAYRPLRNAPRIAPLITALGVSFLIQNSLLLLFGADFKSYDSFDLVDPGTGIHWGPLNVWAIRLVVIGAGILLMFALVQLVSRTRLGKAMRATAFDREAAAMMGIDVDKVIVRTFFIGSALAGAAGVLIGLVFSQINFFMGLNYGLKGFVAAVIGGIGSIPGAMAGGLLIGLAESYAGGYVSTTFTDLIVFSLLIIVMLVRPTGLFAQVTIKKV